MQLGRSVDELFATVSEEEIEEWKAYYAVEPFGSPAEDQRAASICTMVWQTNATAGATVPTFFDRTPEETARLERLRTVDDDAVEDFFASFGTIKVVKQKPEADVPCVSELVDFDPRWPEELAVKPIKRRRKPRR